MSSAVEIAGLQRIEIPWNQGVEDVVIGKDVLELLSSSMYIDPMSIYREYVQNSADAIDDARSQGLLGSKSKGTVRISFDMPNRTVRIRDNGTGMGKLYFKERMTAFGGSQKRGTKARGFRGVGRLAGIGYCQELIFRTRAAGEGRASELRWDCRKIKSVLRATDFSGDLADLVRQVVTWRQTDAKGLPEHFFEVELRGIVRQKSDLLLDPKAVEIYLSQTTPIPFSPSFASGEIVNSQLESHLTLGTLDLEIEGVGQIFRPHQDRFEIKAGVSDSFSDVQFVSIPSVDQGVAAFGWILHHGYKGAIPASANVRGLRLRVGNIQVGDEKLLEDLFAEPRFNAWSVGEIHILDQRVTPNGRRDHFEQNVHYLNLLNHLSPVAREISRRCRTSSLQRNWIRQFEQRRGVVRGKLALLKQGGIGPTKRFRVLSDAKEAVDGMQKIAAREALPPEVRRNLAATLRRVQSELIKMGQRKPRNALSRVRGPKRKVYEQVIGLIYECSQNESAAKALVDKILARL